MTTDSKQDSKPALARGEFHPSAPWVQTKHIVIAAVVVLSVVAALAVLVLPPKYQPVAVLVFPAAVVCLLILRNPFVGVYLYFLYTYLRPYDFIPALLPLRLNLVIELVTIISWLILLVQRREKVRWSRFHWFYLGFLFVIGLGIPFASIGPLALGTWQTLTVYFVMLVITTNVADSSSRLRKLIWLLLLIHFYHALRGIYNFNFNPMVYSDAEKTSGAVGTSFLADENDFALAINLMMPFAFFAFEQARTKFQRLAGALFLVTFALGVVSSFSRGGWVGLVALTIYCVVFSKRKAKSAAAVLLVGLAMFMFAPKTYWQQMETVTDPTESTANERLRSWDAAFRMFLDHPVIGVGAGNAGVHLPDYIRGSSNTDRMWGRAVHGTLPEVLADTGAAGTAMYLLMMFFIIRYLIRIMRRPPPSDETGLTLPVIATALTGSILAYVVTATFLSTSYYPQLWTLYTLAITLYFAYQPQQDKKSPMAAGTTS